MMHRPIDVMSATTPVCSRLAAAFACVFALIASLTPAFAQSQTRPLNPNSDDVQYERLGAEYGVRQYKPGRWGIVAVDISNTGDEAKEVVAQIGFASNGSLLHARRVWVPPHSIRRTWTTIRLPEETTTTRRQDVYCQLLESGAVKQRRHERPQHVNSIRVADDPLVTGIIAPFDERIAAADIDPRYEMIIAARNRVSLGRKLAIIGGRYLPTIPEAYDAVDQLVFTNDRFAEDAAACSAIRGWLQDGGEIWIQLDQVSLPAVATLLGERFRCEVVDRVELHEVEVKSLTPREALRYTGPRIFEAPVPLLRMAVEDADVTHEVNGWPAAITLPFGRGRVVATTVGGAAWVKTGREPRNLAVQGRFDSTTELGELELVSGRRLTPAAPSALEAYLNAQIGYRVVGRSVVVTTLCAFCVFLFACGGVLVFRGGLERMTWLAPLGAIVAATPLVWLGLQAQQSAPPTVAMAQYVQFGDASKHALVSGSLALYQPEAGSVTVGGDQGGVFELDWKGLENSIRRMVRTDTNRWRWEDVSVTAGIRKAEILQQIVADQVMEARGTFDADGFRGSLTGMETPLEDMLIASLGRPATAAAYEGDAIIATPQDQMAAGQFVAGTILSDEQRRRQDVYANLFAGSTQDNPFPSRRLLLGWTAPYDVGFDFPDTQVVGSALVAVPLMIDHPESGAELRIPASFIQFRTASSPDGETGGSALYNARKGEWITSETATRAWLYCAPPREILPVQVQRATLRLKCTIPSRRLTILGADGTREVELLSKPNAIGPIELVIDQPELLKVDESGGFRLGVYVSEPLNANAASELKWNIDYFDVELEAKAD